MSIMPNAAPAAISPEFVRPFKGVLLGGVAVAGLLGAAAAQAQEAAAPAREEAQPAADAAPAILIERRPADAVGGYDADAGDHDPAVEGHAHTRLLGA